MSKEVGKQTLRQFSFAKRYEFQGRCGVSIYLRYHPCDRITRPKTQIHGFKQSIVHKNLI